MTISQYIIETGSRVLMQLTQLFAIPVLLAIALQWVGNAIRRCGVGRFGKAYWYFVAPGVACHETGHAVRCLLTGSKIIEFVPFTMKRGDTLGYVQHESKGGCWGRISSFVISSGPVWLGCLMIFLLTKLFGGTEYVPQYADYFISNEIVGACNYVCGLVQAGVEFVLSIFLDSKWGWRFNVLLYLSFCIASEIGLSGVDLRHMWGGAVGIVMVTIAINLIPALGRIASAWIDLLLPWLFKFHVLMLVALIINISLYVAMLIVFSISQKKQ